MSLIIDESIFEVVPTSQCSSMLDLISKRLEFRHIFRKKGVVLLRGFNIDTEVKFKQTALLFLDNLILNNGEHVSHPDTTGVFVPVNYSPRKKLLWHNENSFEDVWPLTIIFGAIVPAEMGGETPIVDSRKMLLRLDAAVVDEFEKKGVMYTRSHGFGVGISWQKIYQTTSKFELEEICKQKNIQIEWRGDEALITKQIRPAVIQHPLTGERSWFNQAQHWHPFCLDKSLREALLVQFEPDTLPRNCCFGDGSPISDDIVKHILDAYDELEVSFSWEPGDVLILDNVLFAHARNPYTGMRKLLVSMGNM